MRGSNGLFIRQPSTPSFSGQIIGGSTQPFQGHTQSPSLGVPHQPEFRSNIPGPSLGNPHPIGAQHQPQFQGQPSPQSHSAPFLGDGAGLPSPSSIPDPRALASQSPLESSGGTPLFIDSGADRTQASTQPPSQAAGSG